jgi:hypothetical protein
LSGGTVRQWCRMFKDGFDLWMLKRKNTKSSGCTHIHQTSWKSLNEQCLPPRKLMATVLWSKKGVLRVEFMQHGSTMSEVQCKTLKMLCRSTQNKKCGPLTSSLVFLHDNACLHKIADCRIVRSLSLQPWSHSEWLTSVYLSEELVVIIAL